MDNNIKQLYLYLLQENLKVNEQTPEVVYVETAMNERCVFAISLKTGIRYKKGLMNGLRY